MNLASKLKTFLWIILVGLLAYIAVGFCYRAVYKIGYPYLGNLGEPALAQAVKSFAEGRNPYHNLENPPYSLVPYGPVYLVLATLVRLIFKQPFWAGRIVTLIASLGVSFFIYRILRRIKLAWFAAIIPALFFIASPYTDRWGVQVNVDMTAVFFTAALFYCCLEWFETPKASLKLTGITVALTALAFFTKSSFVALPAAFFVALLIDRRFKDAIRYAVISAIVIGSVYLSLNLFTEGQYFYHTTFEISRRRFYPQFIGTGWLLALRDITLAVLGAFLAIVAVFLPKRKATLAALYVLFAGLLTVSLGKQGSDSNYFLDFSLAGFISLGFFWKKIQTLELGPKWNFLGRAREALPVLVLVLLIAQAGVWFMPYRHLTAIAKSLDEQKQFFDGVSRLIQVVPGPILSEDMSLLIANDREIYYEPFPMGQMTYSKVWNPAPIIRALEEKKFQLAVLFFYAPALLANRTFPPEFLEAFRRNYVFMGRSVIPGQENVKEPLAYYFYRPKADGGARK